MAEGFPDGLALRYCSAQAQSVSICVIIPFALEIEYKVHGHGSRVFYCLTPATLARNTPRPASCGSGCIAPAVLHPGTAGATRLLRFIYRISNANGISGQFLPSPPFSLQPKPLQPFCSNHISQRFLISRWDARHASRPMAARLARASVNSPRPRSSRSMARSGS